MRVQVNRKKSEWGNATIRVPQRSVLGPLLFIIFINDLDSEVSSDISKFADDTKIGRKITNLDDVRGLQEDLDKLYEWSEKWQMQFNVDKCSIMSIGKNIGPVDYKINDITLERTCSVKDLGVQVSNNLRPREQCMIARNKANRMLGFINRSVTNRSSEVILKLYLALVRPHLDYAVQFWTPYYKKDIKSLEAVQRRMTKMIQGLKKFSYEERLKRLNLHSLERRRARGDMIEVFKWVKGINKGDINQVLEFSNQGVTQGNGYKLKKYRFRTDMGKYWFSNRVVNEWNKLDRSIVGSETLTSFKKRLDEYMDLREDFCH